MTKNLVYALGKTVLEKNVKNNEQTTWNKHKDVEIEKFFHQSRRFSYRNFPSLVGEVLPDLHFSFLPVSQADAMQFL
ncbi:MAG: hypothetical protein CMI23_12385 [Opitutae bacterium]|nr:hypothetical protein [Opitutae bacterium]